MAAPPQTRYVVADELHIAYQVVGDGPMDVLYVTEVRSPIDLVWDDPLAAHGLRRLASLGRLILLDPRGFGSSDVVDLQQMPAMEAWMDDLRTVMDAAGSERAAVVSSGSETSLSTILFAATYPERASALVLVNPYARFVRSPEQPWAVDERTFDRYVERFREMVGRGPVADLLAPSRAADPAFRRWFTRGERLGAPPGTAAATFRRYARSDVTGVLGSIRVPTLIIHRRGDRHVRAGHAQLLAARIPGARLVELEGEDNVWYSGDVEAVIDEIVGFLTGARAAGHADRVLATVLFTDIVDSTARAAELGDAAWSGLLDAHDTIVRSHVEGFGGRWVKSLGDGALATFDGPARAIRCAVGVRDALSARGLGVRAGLHTGEVERRGDDIGGIAVHIAARIAGLAGPDEVLVSAAVPPLVVGSGLRFRDAGTHALRGVGERWPVFAVEEPG
jgi:class 3 adenylate cyclase